MYYNKKTPPSVKRAGVPSRMAIDRERPGDTSVGDQLPEIRRDDTCLGRPYRSLRHRLQTGARWDHDER